MSSSSGAFQPSYREADAHQLCAMAYAGHPPAACRRCLRLCRWHPAGAGKAPRHHQRRQGDFIAQPSPPNLGQEDQQVLGYLLNNLTREVLLTVTTVTTSARSGRRSLVCSRLNLQAALTTSERPSSMHRRGISPPPQTSPPCGAMPMT